LYYLSADGRLMAAGVRLGADSPAPSTPRELLGVPPSALGSSYSVTPDGKRLLVQMAAGGSQAFEVVVNWPALLKE
jgi:hypothetical protein